MRHAEPPGHPVILSKPFARQVRRDRVVLQSQIRRPDASEYEGGYEHVEGYAAPVPGVAARVS